MSFLIYQEQAGDKLKLIADIDEVETATEAVDALVDALPKFGGEDFIVFESDAREEVTAGQPIVRSVSKGGTRKAAAPAAKKPTRTRKPAAAKPAPAKRTTRKPAAKPKAAASKPAAKKPAAKPAAAKATRSATKKTGSKPSSLKTKAGTAKKRGGIKINTKSAE